MAINFVIPFFCSLLGFTVIFLLNNVFDGLTDFLENKVPFGVTMLYFLAKQPQNLTNVIPISTMLGASFMTLMLGRHNELTAMRSAGLSLMTCALPVWIISLLACLCVFGISESWGSACLQKAQDIEVQYLKKNRQNKDISFHHPQAKRDWTIEQYKSDREILGVSVRQYAQDDSGVFLLAAQEASWDKGEWTFRNGHIQFFGGKSQAAFQAPMFFKEHREKFAEAPGTISSHSESYEMMNIRQLRSVLNAKIINSPKSIRLLRVLLWNRFTFPLASLVGALFGVALTISTDRMGLMKGFAYAVGMLVLFFVLGQFFMVLGKNGIVPPFVGGALPSLLFLLAAILTMRKKA